jgi:arylsulfatase A-like enzyme
MATDVYDECIAYLDGRLGLLLDELRRREVLENTLVIVTSDHGEHLGDHGLFFHGCSLYRQLVHVPLVIVGKTEIPVGRTVAEPVSLCDLPATVIDLLGLGANHPFTGQSVARYWQPRGEGIRVVASPLFMETTKPELLMNGGREPAAKGPMRAIVVAGMHYIRMADGTHELFNLAADLEEKTNLVNDSVMQPVLFELQNLLGLMLKRR